ncbi:SDR family oxidoreductase [Cytophagaceae bacterium DM2B3-1]|uniref:SDR family oxidoreductase n=1 Tax=Xanthocytophaga flava TaxID=3048013 RepID=A0ABT7CEY0_9BACT|nr:SDR family oxidoreductase [Xanthocytophaga flavus]MDJ1472260.1 SDR family oxidoreductase [Xanthocytophaga flavus]MDJ1492271.1 SDR family oxidoreductase [Xanthocytophaga flavus]
MNRLLIVTGGTKGIGKAIVWKFAANGFDIITCARTKKDLLSLQQEFESTFTQSKLFWQCADLSKKEQVLQFADFINWLNRPVDVLVNNSGFFVPGQVYNEPEGALESQIDANLYSAYYLSRALLPPMIKRQDGHIFTMCSIASIIAYPNGGSYSISKFALYGMTKVLREELKDKGIRVTAVLPGATLTASWEGTSLPPDRFMKSEDVAEAIYSTHCLSKNTVVEEIVLRPQLGDIN